VRDSWRAGASSGSVRWWVAASAASLAEIRRIRCNCRTEWVESQRKNERSQNKRATVQKERFGVLASVFGWIGFAGVVLFLCYASSCGWFQPLWPPQAPITCPEPPCGPTTPFPGQIIKAERVVPCRREVSSFLFSSILLRTPVALLFALLWAYVISCGWVAECSSSPHSPRRVSAVTGPPAYRHA